MPAAEGLAVASLERDYPDFHLGPIDLQVGREVLAVLGPSGCGKTTLLSLVAGLLEPTAGRVSLGGRDVTGLPPERRGTALLFQDGALFPHLTARENVAYAATGGASVDALAERLEITDVLARKPAALSGGQRGRVALARALAADPDALLLDEPLGSLDAPVARRLRAVMRDVLGGLAVPVIYVTHDQREAAAVGDRVAVMNDGAFEQVEDPETVFERPASPFVADFTGTRNRLPARVEDGAVAWAGQRFRLPGGHGFAAGDPVWLCVRPEHVDLQAIEREGDRARGGEEAGRAPGVGRGERVEATVEARTFKGDGHALTVAPSAATETVDVWVSAASGRSVPAAGDVVAVGFPPAAIHLLGR